MKKKVVLVQDNKNILEIMDQVLTEEGFDVTSSLTTEPIEKIDKIEPDVVIIDDHIKGNKKGSEVIEELKSEPETEDISAVLTSTSNDLAKKAKECKADDYIEKPFDLDHLIEVVKKKNIECNAQIASSNQSAGNKAGIITGADQTEKYLPYLKGKRIGLVANQSSMIGKSEKQRGQFIEPWN
jgi:two-component system response regulator VicR